MRLLPTWDWLWKPSGGPVEPGTMWYRRPIDSPILAHPLGMLVWVLVLLVEVQWQGSWFASTVCGGPLPFMVWCSAVDAEGVNQAHKLAKKAYGPWFGAGSIQNVSWRLSMAAIAALAVVRLIGLLGWW